MTNGGNAAEVARPLTAELALQLYPEMVAAVPEAEFDADGSGILADVLMATAWEQLNESQSALPDAEKMTGRAIFVQKIGRMKSDLEGGLGFYLIVDAVDSRNGELVKFQTSSATVMAKLVKLHLWGIFPAEVTITKATKPTRQGRYPLDMTVHHVTQPAKAVKAEADAGAKAPY